MPGTKQISTVGEGGRVEVVVRGFRAGETVEVSVERVGAAEDEPSACPPRGERPMDFLAGKFWIADDFDAPLDDFRDYM